MKSQLFPEINSAQLFDVLGATPILLASYHTFLVGFSDFFFEKIHFAKKKKKIFFKKIVKIMKLKKHTIRIDVAHTNNLI